MLRAEDHAETELKLARLTARHETLKRRIDTGLDVLQRRMDQNIERFRADTASAIKEVQLCLKDEWT